MSTSELFLNRDLNKARKAWPRRNSRKMTCPFTCQAHFLSFCWVLLETTPGSAQPLCLTQCSGSLLAMLGDQRWGLNQAHSQDTSPFVPSLWSHFHRLFSNFVSCLSLSSAPFLSIYKLVLSVVPGFWNFHRTRQSHLWVYLKDTKMLPWKVLFTPLFIAMLLIITKIWE